MKLLIDFIIVLGISVNSIILLSLFKRKAYNLQHKLFISIFVILLFLLITSYGIFNKIRWLLYLAILFQGITYLLGPLIYLYFNSLTFKNDGFVKKKGWHFLPFLSYFLIITIPLLISALSKEYIFSYLSFINDHSNIANVIEVLFVLFYLVLSLKVFYRMKASLKNMYATMEYKNVQWIEVLVYGLIICSLIQLLILLIEATTGSSDYLDLLLIISYVAFICYLGYFGLQQQQVISINDEDKEISNDHNNTFIEKRKYMSDAEVNTVNDKIILIFEHEKPYLDEDLTLTKLAILLDTTDKKLSYYLNNHLQISFYDFINKYRITAFKNKLKNNDQQNFSLLGLAYDSGFKSKSSFNRVFKKETGLSPSAYLKSL